MSQCWPRPRSDTTWGSLSANDTQIWSRGPWSRLMAFPWVKSSDHTRKPTDLPRSAAAARRRPRPAFPSDVFVLSPVNPNSDVRPATCNLLRVRPSTAQWPAMPLPSLTVCVSAAFLRHRDRPPSIRRSEWPPRAGGKSASALDEGRKRGRFSGTDWPTALCY